MILQAGDVVKIKMIAPSVYRTGINTLLDGNSAAKRCLFEVDASGKLTYNTSVATATFDGNVVDNGVTDAPTDGLRHVVELAITDLCVISLVGTDYTKTNYCNFAMFDLQINSVNGNRFYPINDGWSANPTIKDSLTTTREVYHFDGIDDYITIPQVDLVSGDVITVKFVAPTNTVGVSNSLISSANDNFTYCNYAAGNAIYLLGFTGTLDGVEIVNGVSKIPTDGFVHEIVLTSNRSGDVGLVGARFQMDNYVAFPIYDVDIQAASGNRFYPVDDGWSNNPVIADNLNPQSSQPELVTNGTFDTDVSGWTQYGNGSTVWDNGSVILTFNSNRQDIAQTLVTKAGSTYRVQVDVSDLSSIWGIDFGSQNFGSRTDSGRIILDVVANSASTDFRVTKGGNNGTSVRIDNVSVKEYTHGTAENFQEVDWISQEVNTDATANNFEQSNWRS